MNAELIKSYFDADADAMAALSPLLTLTAGMLLLLVAELFERLRPLRSPLAVLTLLGAGWCHVRLLVEPVGAVLGDTYAADRLTAAWGLIFVASVLVAWIHARRYYRADQGFLGEHDVLMLATPIGMTMMAGAQDLTVFFVGLELLSIPLYCLAAFRRRRNDSVEAGLKYFVLGAFGVGLFLFGAALTYVATGSLAIAEIGARLAEGATPLALTGLGLMVASLFFKLSIFPLHLWVPDVYQGSPTPITALMATGTKAAALAFLMRLATVLPGSTATLLGILAVLTMAAGNLGALVQANLKRMLAYSGIAHAGTVLLVVAGAVAAPALYSEAGQAALYYMAAYVFTAGGAFGLLAWLEVDGDHFTEIENLKGLARRRPGIAAALSLFLLSLGGIPATGGFLGKWFVFSVAVRADLVVLSILGVLLSVVALGYYLRVIVAMYMEPAPEDKAPPMTQLDSATFVTAFCAGMVLVLGVLPGAFLKWMP